MKYLLLTLLAQAGKSNAIYQRYCYPEQNLTVTVEADTREEGLKKAANICFKALTKGRYPGEEKGLDIIDTCANPKRCNQKETR